MQDLDFTFNRLDDDEDGLTGPAVARLSGRLARVDPGKDATEAVLWLICEDEGYLDDDGQPRAGLYQAIRVFAKMSNLGKLTFTSSMTPQVEVTCSFHRGQLCLTEILDVTDAGDEPLPSAKVPKRPEDMPHRNDGKLIAPAELEKMAGSGGFTAQAHSVYRIPIAWHLTMCPKYRARSFEGRAAEVQRILRSVAEEEGLQVLAVAAEDDHVHVLLRGMTPQTTWSTWVGRWKAVTSRRIKMQLGIEDFAWQVGYSLSTVAGGKQSAEEALLAVEAYISAQGDRSDDHEVTDVG